MAGMRLAEGLAPLLSGADAVKANPRLMKRFLNTVYLRAALSEPQGITVEIPALAKWHLLGIVCKTSRHSDWRAA